MKLRIIAWALLLTVVLALPVMAEGPEKLDAARLWPEKAAWVGQQASLVPAKMYQSASYLLLYAQPGTVPSGVEQLALARESARKSFLIEGLYQYRQDDKTDYYWRLTGPGKDLWLKDTKLGRLEALPIALPAEYAAEAGRIETLSRLAGTTVWLNRNEVLLGELSADVPHLTRLTVIAFRSTGPFGDKYGFDFTLPDGKTISWKIGFTGERVVYNHQQFKALFDRSFFASDPKAAHPDWPDELWAKISARTIEDGWTEDMVLLSWGEPEQRSEPKKGLTQWQYPNQYTLYLKDKRLEKITLPRPVDPAVRQVGPKKPADFITVNTATRK